MSFYWHQKMNSTKSLIFMAGELGSDMNKEPFKRPPTRQGKLKTLVSTVLLYQFSLSST